MEANGADADTLALITWLIREYYVSDATLDLFWFWLNVMIGLHRLDMDIGIGKRLVWC